ncbi:MAG: 23S rRNA (uracil(1939)-C(5))-methyltransferase RlmD [Bacteroidales bacterium]|nr:23S rRNA (uracil(1939)-C(5))-methyltransferase RlmD [Bacteroidales bacterium]
MKKDDILRIKIESIGEDGDGIGLQGKFKIYVPNTMPGDKVKVRIEDCGKTYAHACLERLIEKSPMRIKPVCEYVLRCGGCQILEMDYNEQLKLKRHKVEQDMKSVKLPETYKMMDTIGCQNTFRFRNKAIYPISKDSDGNIITGFYTRRSHNIAQGSDCKIGAVENPLIMDVIIKHLKDNNIEPYDEVSRQGVVRHVMIRKAFDTGEIMVSIIINAETITNTENLVKSLLKAVPAIKDISLNINRNFGNTIKGNQVKTLYGNGYITDTIGDIKFKISPLSFYQVNPAQTKILYSKALEYANLEGDETVFDLYCGVGTISLFLSQKARKVIGVEVIEQAINDARENARINNISNTEFHVGKAEEVIPDLIENKGVRADVVVVDPPRKGCDKTLLDTIIKMKPRRMVYVSCNSETLARDLKYLSENGFFIEKIQPVDMFPNSIHVETVATLNSKL